MISDDKFARHIKVALDEQSSLDIIALAVGQFEGGFEDKFEESSASLCQVTLLVKLKSELLNKINDFCVSTPDLSTFEISFLENFGIVYEPPTEYQFKKHKVISFAVKGQPCNTPKSALLICVFNIPKTTLPNLHAKIAKILNRRPVWLITSNECAKQLNSFKDFTCGISKVSSETNECFRLFELLKIQKKKKK